MKLAKMKKGMVKCGHSAAKGKKVKKMKCGGRVHGKRKK